MIRLMISRLALALPLASAAAQAPAQPSRICLAPTGIETVTGNASDAMNAVRDAFTSYLTGPSLTVTPLSSRLASQAREEARAANCPYILLTSIRHTRKSGGNGLMGRMAGSAVQQGVYAAGSSVNNTAGRVATNAAAGAAGTVAYSYGSAVRAKDELALTTRLESATGVLLVQKTDERKAKSDNEDLLTPLVQKAAEAVASAIAKTAR